MVIFTFEIKIMSWIINRLGEKAEYFKLHYDHQCIGLKML